MQFSGKLNEAEVKEATRFVRPKGYARRQALTYVRLGIYAAIVLWILFATFVRHEHIRPSIIVTRVVFLVLIGVFAYLRYRRGSREAVANLDATLPDRLTLTAEGVRLEGPNGAEGFQPWASYMGYREGEHVVVLQRRELGLYNVVPVSALGAPEREQLKGLLGSYLSPVAK